MKIDFNLRRIFIISIIAICIIVINLAVFFQITSKPKKKAENEKEEVIIDRVVLTENFAKIFDNTIDYQEDRKSVV